MPAPVAYIRNRLAVIDKKSLGLSMIAAVVIAAILPGLPAASAFFAWLVNGVAGPHSHPRGHGRRGGRKHFHGWRPPAAATGGATSSGG